MTYSLDYGYTNTLTKPKHTTHYACLSPVRYDGINTNYKYLWVHLKNSWENEKLSAEEYIEQFLEPLNKYYVEIKLSKDYSQVWFDTSKYNWSQVGTIVTLLRYLGGHKDYIENYLKVIEAYPKMEQWQAFHCSHKLGGSNWNHALVDPGVDFNKKVDDFSIEKVIEKLDKMPPKELGIHTAWGRTTFGPLIQVEAIPMMFENPYFLEKEAA